MTEKMTKEQIKENPTEIKELCFSGACNRGICYIGCMKKFEEAKILKLEKILGVSIGSFIAACYIIGYDSDELLEIVMNKNSGDFKDITFEERGSILKGENYKKWVYDIINVKINPDITLKELYEKTKIHFMCTTTCIYSEDKKYEEGIVIMSHENTPDIPLIIAINSSMAFPFVFPPVNYNNAKFIDGGILDNIPKGLLDDSALNLRVNLKPINGSTSINNPISYIGKIFELVSKRYIQLKNFENKNIIRIPTEDFNMIDFDMSIDDKITLFKRGYNAASEYLFNTSDN
jgi:NTE family protein